MGRHSDLSLFNVLKKTESPVFLARNLANDVSRQLNLLPARSELRLTTNIRLH